MRQKGNERLQSPLGNLLPCSLRALPTHVLLQDVLLQDRLLQPHLPGAGWKAKTHFYPEQEAESDPAHTFL